MKYPSRTSFFATLLLAGFAIMTLGRCNQVSKPSSSVLHVNCTFGEPKGEDSALVRLEIVAALIDENGDSLSIMENLDSLAIYSECKLEDGKYVSSSNVQTDSSMVSHCRGGDISMSLHTMGNEPNPYDLNLMLEIPDEPNCNGNLLKAGGLIVIVVESLTDPPVTITMKSAQGWHNGKPIPTVLN
jgi:hypothetical protein